MARTVYNQLNQTAEPTINSEGAITAAVTPGPPVPGAVDLELYATEYVIDDDTRMITPAVYLRRFVRTSAATRLVLQVSYDTLASQFVEILSTATITVPAGQQLVGYDAPLRFAGRRAVISEAHLQGILGFAFNVYVAS